MFLPYLDESECMPVRKLRSRDVASEGEPQEVEKGIGDNRKYL
jgi:hypothetical protein